MIDLDTNTFMGAYQAEESLCDEIINFYNQHKKYSTPGQSYNQKTQRGEADNNIKESFDLGVSAHHHYYPMDEYRSLSFRKFKDILNIKGINFFKLSQNVKNDEFLDFHSFSNLKDFGNKSLFEISEVMRELDLVISSDTSIIHLAGILNIKSILLLNYNSDWRWFEDKKKTIWYPSVEIIKQKTFNSWDNVFYELKKKIEKLTYK